MIPSSTSPRRGSLLTQLDFEDILHFDRNPSLVFPTRSNDIDQHSNLQVVPDLESQITRRNSTGLEREFTGLHFTWPLVTTDTAPCTSSKLSTERVEADNFPRSPFLPRTSISEIDNMGILSPLFSITNASSPILKTPSTLYEICCSSRKSSDDLSIYLPENYTPASLEVLDQSINRTVFQFPVPASKTDHPNDCVFVENKTGNKPTFVEFTSKDLPNQETAKHTINDSTAQNAVNGKFNEVDSLLDMNLVKRKRAKIKQTKTHSKVQTAKRQKTNDFNDDQKCIKRSTEKECSPLLRNKMERDRRTDLNNRFQKLRESLPDSVSKGNISKVSILKAASVYVDELIGQESALEGDLRFEKNRNEELLKKLVDISNNLGEK